MTTSIAPSEASGELENVDIRSVKGPRSSLLSSLLTGVGALGLALGIERGGSFLSNVLAARLGGTAVFGAYSIALTAANNVAWYVGAGIGTTATRFTAEHAPGSKGYHQVVRSLMLIALISALAATLALWFGAGPMATMLLKNKNLEGPLKVAALSAGAFVVLECCRGVFLGTRSFARLLVLSGTVGIGLLIAVPRAAKLGASQMVAGQVAAVLVAVLVSVLLTWKHPELRLTNELREIEPPSLGRVWRFGLMQLGGVIGMNAAGWWTASLVARWDTSLIQIAFYTVATQLRNVCSLIPSLVQQSNFAFFTDEGARDFGGADRVIAVSSITSSALSIFCAGLAIVGLPWVLGHFYGKDYVKAELPAVFAIATVLVHFGISPAASRLVVVSLKWSGITNGIWAVFVGVMGTLLIPSAGATAATATLFLAHALSSILVLFSLWLHGALPERVSFLAGLDIAAAFAITALAWLRSIHPNQAVVLNLSMLAVTIAMTLYMLRFGQNCGAFPKKLNLAALRARLPFNQSV